MSAKRSTDARAAALECLLAVLGGGQSLDAALAEALPALADPRDRGFCQALAYGVLREHRRLGALRDHLLRTPLRRRDHDVALLIELGLYQLLGLEIPAHAAVSQTVALAHGRKKAWAAKLANAVLRRFQREMPQVLAAIDEAPGVRYSVPDWLLARLQTDYPERWLDLLVAQNQRAPMTLRINARAASTPSLPAAQPLAGFADARVLEQAVGLETLPAFAEGAVSVQDAAAQLAADVLDAQAGDRVLDACAAPGGKTAHILERADVNLLALDRDAQRLASVDRNLERLGLSAHSQVGDAGDPSSWWDGERFRRILLDAPCSGSGVIRRHPDIKWLRRERDIAELQRGQQRLLAALWPLLEPGGRLVYATCSVFYAENEAVVSAFMADHDDAQALPLTLPVGHSVGYGQQILTGESGVDGFYYACLQKR